jgi:hypothetical protein
MTPTTSTPSELGAASCSALKVIFLDIDGVLSSFGLRGLCGTRLDMFADIVKQTGAEVVLASTWRHPHCRDQRMRLQQELGKREVEFFGMTPILGTTRGEEIKRWISSASRRHQIDFVILDDDPNDEMGELKPHLVKCDGYQGLTPDIAAEVVHRLNDKGLATQPAPQMPEKHK